MHPLVSPLGSRSHPRNNIIYSGPGADLSTVEVIHGTGTGVLVRTLHSCSKTAEVNKAFEDYCVTVS